MLPLPFATRTDAGRALADKLLRYRDSKDTLILALVRGGVVVGRAIADNLNLPLYPYVVRKLGHPAHREYALGAIAEGGSTFFDDDALRGGGIEWGDMEPIIEEETEELKRRKEAYLVHARPDLAGKTILLTDDGAATGATLFAAIEDLRKAKAKKIIVTLPVCPPDTAENLRKKADDMIVLATPEPFEAVGKWYGEFPQTAEEEVLALLQSFS
ncbi:MAG: phosphoribosyltransferase family protein [Candidatus Peregrinibacteria bacterium]